MNVLGLSFGYHEAACCLLRDGVLLAAAEEERFSRVKHDPSLPIGAFRYCLRRGGLDITEIDVVAFHELPERKLARQIWALAGSSQPGGAAAPSRVALPRDPGLIARAIREDLGYEGPVDYFSHHASHAASAYLYSGFERAAVLTVDGVGEWATTSYGLGEGCRLELFEEVEFPHSLGLLYATLTAYLGFRVNRDEYKVMGLAPYGEPRFEGQIRELVRSGPRGQYALAMEYFDFVHGARMYSPALVALFGAPPRDPGAELTGFHQDVARSLQLVLEETLLEKVAYLHRAVGSSGRGTDALCMAGGVALNVVANGRIQREGPFARVFVQPAAGDAGACLGAAALAYARRAGAAVAPLRHVYLGPDYPADEIARLLAAAGLDAHDFRDREPALLAAVVDRLAAGQVLGWFQGAMEFGPRALGARSILADPRDPQMRDRLNGVVKLREAFRPFAPSVLAEHAREHFALEGSSPYMLQTCAVRSPLALPAVTHVDGSARPHTVDASTAPRFAALLAAFGQRTGCPILVNTSFNVGGMPIVCSPEDALLCMACSGLDALVLGDFLLDRSAIPNAWRDGLGLAPPGSFLGARSAPPSDLVYTFV